MEKDKTLAFTDFKINICKSWTWERLTTNERGRVLKALEECEHTAIRTKYTYKERFEIFHAVYRSFLMALDYTPNGWRETDPNAPKF